MSGNRCWWRGGGRKPSGGQDLLTWLEEDQVGSEIVQQLHNPMFFQIIPGPELPAAAGALHDAAGLLLGDQAAPDRQFGCLFRRPVARRPCPGLRPGWEPLLSAAGRRGVGRRWRPEAGGAEPPVGDARPRRSRLRAGPGCLLLCSVFVRQVSEAGQVPWQVQSGNSITVRY